MSSRTIKILSVLALVVCALGMEAQMLPNPYGPPITVENAKKAAAAALAEAVKNHWVMAVAIVDPEWHARLLREIRQHADWQRQRFH